MKRLKIEIEIFVASSQAAWHIRLESLGRGQHRDQHAKPDIKKGREGSPMKMTTEEAFVKVLQMHGIEHAFGIIGSAFMPISDLFPKAGITFWDVAHETNGGLICDGYTRSTGKMAMAIAQNGPGITGFVTPIKTAY